MLLKIHNHPTLSRPGTINYRFRDLLAALDILGSEERTWILSGAIVTWPDAFLDERMEVHDPRVRFSRDRQDFVCTQELFVQIAEGIEGDWTNVYATSAPLDQVPVERIQAQQKISCDFHFECVDAAFWAIETERTDLIERLEANGFRLEILEKAFWRP